MQTTPKLLLPYPEPADAITDYPAVAHDFAFLLDGMLPKLISRTPLTAGVAITALSEATANPIITAPAATFLAGDVLLLELYLPQITTPLNNGALTVIHFFVDGTSFGNAAVLGQNSGGASHGAFPLLARQYITPGAGSKVISARGRCSIDSAQVSAGAGSVGTYAPGYLSITKT